jgi:hypothetical protein
MFAVAVGHTFHANRNFSISSFNYGIQTTIKEMIFHQTTSNNDNELP